MSTQMNTSDVLCQYAVGVTWKSADCETCKIPPRQHYETRRTMFVDSYPLDLKRAFVYSRPKYSGYGSPRSSKEAT
jgi:hypothetical protein